MTLLHCASSNNNNNSGRRQHRVRRRCFPSVGVLLAIGAVVSLLELVRTILSNPEELSRLCLVQQFAILIICRRFDKKMGQAKVS